MVSSRRWHPNNDTGPMRPTDEGVAVNRRGAAVLFICFLIVLPGADRARAEGPFIGQFELKNLESEHGYLEFQSQNAYASGQPRRRIEAEDPDEGEYLYDENEVIRQRHALEMEMGFSRHLKARIGIEFEKERIEEPDSPAEANDFGGLKLTEVGGEVIAILVPREGDGMGLGAVVEIERPILSAKGDQMALIMGPIIEWARGPFSASLVPMAVHHFGGRLEEEDDGSVEPLDHKWDFAYAAQIAYRHSEAWTLALEAYGTVDRLGDSGHPSLANETFGDLDQHRLGPIVYWSMPLEPASSGANGEEASELTVGLGYFAGLTEYTPDSTLKLSVEVDF